MSDEPTTSESLDLLGDFAEEFTAPLEGRRDEAMALFEDAVARWPWNNQAVDSFLWLLTDGMTAKPR